MEKFKNKYRIESNRLKGWNYGANAMYFITICCKNRECYFGNIENSKMKLAAIGHIANSCWVEIPKHFPFVMLHNHIIMPNHIHGIIEIAKTNVDDAFVSDDAFVETPKLGVSTSAPTSAPSLRTHNASQKWKSNTLGSIINQYKRICTINARKTNPNFAWQPNYHDHIIRDDRSYKNISNYIINNPKKWESDKFNSNNPNSDK